MISEAQAQAIGRRRLEARMVAEKPSGFLSWRGAYDADMTAAFELVESSRRDEAKHVEILLETFIAGRAGSQIATREHDVRAVTEVLELLRSIKGSKGSLT